HALDVHRMPPRRLAIFDDPRPRRTRRDAKADAAVAFGVAATAAATHHVRRGNDRHSILLVGLAVDAADRDRIFRLIDNFERVHGTPPQVAGRCAPRGPGPCATRPRTSLDRELHALARDYHLDPGRALVRLLLRFDADSVERVVGAVRIVVIQDQAL